MSDIDFQNGFICGMATKGLIKTGEPYSPDVWNDNGVYSYFYIDFKQSISDFSLGMWSESCTVSDMSTISVTDVKRVSESIYKIIADISHCNFGVTVSGKIDNLLTFATGELIPLFSVNFTVSGLTASIRLKYTYDQCNFNDGLGSTWETQLVDISAGSIDGGTAYDSANSSSMQTPFNLPIYSTNELTHSVVLT